MSKWRLLAGDVDRLAHDAARVVQVRNRVVDLHESAEVVDRRVAPAGVEVVHKRRAPGWAEYGVIAADLDGVRGIARVLGELARRARLDDPAAHPRLEAHALAVHVGARVVEDRENLGIAAKLHPDLLKKPVGVALDEVEALLAEDPERTELAEDAGRTRDHGAPADTRGPPASSASSCRRGFPRLNRHARRSPILQAVLCGDQGVE